jgi:adenylate cyclase
MQDQPYKRKLTAILSADVAGYSRLMGENEADTVRTLTAYRKILNELVQQHRGRVIDSPGDNILAEFASVVDAVQCAVAAQDEFKSRNAELTANRRMEFRMGVNLGDVIEEGGRIYGDGVNIAARLEALGEAGGICISGTAYDHVHNKLHIKYDYFGERQVKNIARPVRVYKVVKQTGPESRFLQNEESPLPLPDKPSIAVLPFSNMSGSAEQEYFSDGITEDIITALSRSPWLFVISRNSSFAYRGVAIDIKQVSQELGVRYILEGSVRKAGNRVRVTAQLIDGHKGNHVWAEKYDGELHDIFDLQDQITQQVVGSLHTQIHTYVSESTTRCQPDAITWDFLAKGWKLFYELNQESLVEAEKIFRRAVKNAPTSCEAHYLLAGVLIHQVFMGYANDRRAKISEAYEIAKCAVLHDDKNEYAHCTLGLAQLFRGKFDIAISEYKRAIEINPNCSHAYGLLGGVLSQRGDTEDSIRYNEMAIRLSPRDPSIFFRYCEIAMAHFRSGRYLEASQWALKSVHRKPSWRMGLALLAASLVQLNELDKAKEAIKVYLENIPNESFSTLRIMLGFGSPEDASRFEKALRTAGLPE